MMDGSAMLTLIYVGGCSIGQPYYVSCSGLNWLLVCMSAAGCCGAQALICWLCEDVVWILWCSCCVPWCLLVV
ncbi:unnamed protein product [Camellia sinensis]